MATRQLEPRVVPVPGLAPRAPPEGLERLPLHPTALVIFGVTGDLARRRLLPAIYNLVHDGMAVERISLVGAARREMSDAAFRDMAAQAIRSFSRRRPDEQLLGRLLRNWRYISGAFDGAGLYAELRETLAAFDDEAGGRLDRCLYLSTAPVHFAPIVSRLGEHGLDQPEVRVVIEKPFGTTLAEARQLNRKLRAVFPESQLFRIDHYLGKETVQNMLALRFANYLFEPLWDRNSIDHVEITVAECAGVAGRARYYDRTGALRDTVQNHLLQLLCHVAMDPPADLTADRVRDEKVKVLRAIRAPRPAQVARVAVRGQYAAGTVGSEPVPGYREEQVVAEGSPTETYAALRLEVCNWRWEGVPFYLRTGKRLARDLTEIAVTLKPVPHLGFVQDGSVGVQPNRLILTIEPDEGVSLLLMSKIPGPRMRIRPVKMEFLYADALHAESPEAYERLLLDVMRGDQTLFIRDDEVEAQWAVCDPILDAWTSASDGPPLYRAGSQGPAEAASILRSGHAWRRI